MGQKSGSGETPDSSDCWHSAQSTTPGRASIRSRDRPSAALAGLGAKPFGVVLARSSDKQAERFAFGADHLGRGRAEQFGDDFRLGFSAASQASQRP